jgi:hypothetical protein
MVRPLEETTKRSSSGSVHCPIYGHLWKILHWIVSADKATLMLPVRSRWWSLVINWVPMEAPIPACKSLFSDSLDNQNELLDEGSGVLSHTIRCESVDTTSLASQWARRNSWLPCKSKCKFCFSIRRNPHTPVNESHC